VPIIGWLQILVVIALSELWRYERLGDFTCGDGENLGKQMGKPWKNSGKTHGKTMGTCWKIMGERWENYGKTDD